MEARKVSHSRVTMTEMVLPTHTNSLNTAFGGVIMSWIDIAAAIAAQRHSSKSVVTASIDELHFLRPVYAGWIVNLMASVNFVSKTSMEVGVRIEAENPIQKIRYHTASAYLTFVALDKDGKPQSIPELITETEKEQKRQEAAKERRRLRLEKREFLKKFKV